MTRCGRLSRWFIIGRRVRGGVSKGGIETRESNAARSVNSAHSSSGKTWIRIAQYFSASVATTKTRFYCLPHQANIGNLYLFAHFTAEWQFEFFVSLRKRVFVAWLNLVGRLESAENCIINLKYFWVSCKWTDLEFYENAKPRSRVEARSSSGETWQQRSARERESHTQIWKFISFQFPCTTWHQQTMSQQKHLLVSNPEPRRSARSRKNHRQKWTFFPLFSPEKHRGDSRRSDGDG